MRAVQEQFESYVKLNRKIPPESVSTISQITEPGKLADAVASQLSVKLSDKQDLLELADMKERLERVFSLMEGEMGMLQMERKIKNRVKRQMEKTQREYYLNEQMKAIQRELGEQGGDGGERDEVGELEQKIADTPLTEEARTKAEAEIKKLRQMSPMSAESTVVRNYLDWILALPWGNHKDVETDLGKAEQQLDDDHYGLEKVKERILEYLAVQQRTKKMKGPILCLVGPPGVGKTSLGRSIAEATGRDFVRVSLGGVRDESEIRGHRRTYIGSMPGRIIQSLKKAKTGNPLFLLDEIDKMGMDHRGDPASALLEVLDPEQNATFNDHYLEVDYDLSDVMFVTTANSLNMPQPLLDRMEIIRIAGYTEDEKLEITKRHLIPQVRADHGLKDEEWIVTDDAIRDLVRYYTREGGVRSLKREIARLARKAVRRISTAPTSGTVMISHDGATPKDGPSAGVGMTTAIVSLLTGNPVDREVAMTGEISLRGNVLPIGGLKEKLLAALRGGIKTVLIPEENAKDLAEIPDRVKEGLTIIPVSDINEVLQRALTRPLTPIEWSAADEAALQATLSGQGGSGTDTARPH
ncbi:UNVERIFIED_CONTAM: hypothetical protein GTU68_030681 [Idotea baltica]|nr:hypothetical protein [Idotea baltica]